MPPHSNNEMKFLRGLQCLAETRPPSANNRAGFPLHEVMCAAQCTHMELAQAAGVLLALTRSGAVETTMVEKHGQTFLRYRVTDSQPALLQAA